MNFKRYFLAELKRMSRLFPKIMGLAVIFFAVTVFVGKLLIANSDFETGKSKYRIGLVMEGNSEYIDLGIYLLQNLDDCKFLFELKRFDDVNVAKKALSRNEISALAAIPDTFVDSINYLTNDSAITFYTLDSKSGIISVYMDEVTSLVSNYILYPEAGILSLMEYMDENGYPANMKYEKTDELFLEYVTVILNRGKLTEVETLGLCNGLSTYGYFFVGLTLFFISVLSFAGISFFLGKSRSLDRIAYAQGITPKMQVFSDFAAFYLCSVLCILIMLVPLFIGLKFEIVTIPEFANPVLRDFFEYLINVLIATILLSLFEMLAFEFLDGTVNKVIFSFVVIVGAGYVSGYLYPKSFFPEFVQKAGEALPTGVALSFLSDAVATGHYSLKLLILLIYSAVIFAAMCGLRLRKIRR